MKKSKSGHNGHYPAASIVMIGILLTSLLILITGTLRSIFTAYKNLDGESIRLNPFQVIIATLGIVAALAVLPYSLTNQKINNMIENKRR